MNELVRLYNPDPITQASLISRGVYLYQVELLGQDFRVPGSPRAE